MGGIEVMFFLYIYFSYGVDIVDDVVVLVNVKVVVCDDCIVLIVNDFIVFDFFNVEVEWLLVVSLFIWQCIFDKVSVFKQVLVCYFGILQVYLWFISGDWIIMLVFDQLLWVMLLLVLMGDFKELFGFGCLGSQ